MISRKDQFFKVHLIAANIVNHNISDIKTVTGQDLKNIDLLFYSFPCQGLSIANMGRDQGIGINSKSTSNIIWEIKRILLDLQNQGLALPRYLILENVSNLLNKRHSSSYNRWKNFLKKLGYQTQTLELNGLNYNSVQNRRRVFGISILNGNFNWTDYEFNQWFETKYARVLSLAQRRNRYRQILSASNHKLDELGAAMLNDTKSRHTIVKNNRALEMGNRSARASNLKWTFSTLSTKQDRHPNIGTVKVTSHLLKEQGKLSRRLITTREAYLIMGFTNHDFNRVNRKYKVGILTKESLYRQAGNSIIVSVAEAVFNFISDLEKGEIWSDIETFVPVHQR